MCKAKGFIQVRQLSQFRRDLKIADLVVLVDHNHRAAQEVGIFEQETMGLAEVSGAKVGQERHIGDLGLLRKTLLRKRGL